MDDRNSPIAPGTRIENYVVERVLGRGGMATVYLVRQVRLGSLHALKLLDLPSRAITSRLEQEGRVQASLQHPNIVAVQNIVTYEGCPGLVMEYVNGVDLYGLLATRRPTLDEIDEIAQGIIKGVRAAHRAELVHRDLKPANILLATTPEGLTPKIADFGLVKVFAPTSADGVTRTGQVFGTPQYMSPEQFKNAKIADARSDIWSLGCILYELITGTRAFPGTDLFEVHALVQAGRYPPIVGIVPSIPARMANAVDGCLKLAPADRLQSCDALLATWRGEITPVANVSGAVDASLAAPLPILTAPVAAPAPPTTDVPPDATASQQPDANRAMPASLVAYQPPPPTAPPRSLMLAGIMGMFGAGSLAIATAVATVAVIALVVGAMLWTNANPTREPAPPTPATFGATAPAPVEASRPADGADLGSDPTQPNPTQPDPTQADTPRSNSTAPPSRAPADAPTSAATTTAATDGISVIPSHPACAIDDTVEAAAAQGRLTETQLACATSQMRDLALSQTERARFGRVALIHHKARCDAGQGCDTYEREQRWYFDRVTQSEADLLYTFTTWLARQPGDQQRDVRTWAGRTLALKQSWTGASYITRVDALLGIDAQAAYTTWVSSPDNYDLRIGARNAALDWLTYREQVGKDTARALEVCVAVAPDPAVCAKRQRGDIPLVTVTLVSVPNGLTVHVDGQPSGVTPLKLDLPYGAHIVSLSASDKTVRQSIEVGSGLPTRWTWRAASDAWESAFE